MPEWLSAAALWASARWLAPPAATCTCVVEQGRIQPELLDLLGKQLDRCGPANLTALACVACPPVPADHSVLFFWAGALAGFCLGAALALLWGLLCGGDCCGRPSAAPPSPEAPPAAASPQAVESSPAALGRRRAAPGTLALRDVA